jgi:hypothetical protein
MAEACGHGACLQDNVINLQIMVHNVGYKRFDGDLLINDQMKLVVK